MNTHETIVPKTSPFYVVDFDRTLADSDKLLDVFLGVVGNYLQLPREQIEAADADVKARGDSFDTATYVRSHLADRGESEKWSDLEKRFIHESRALNMLLPGATELLDWFEKNNYRYGILTYGNPLWQHLKLTAAGFNHINHIVIEQKEKGRLVATWQQADGIFHLPQEFSGGIADSIIMIDDKAVSFEGFPGLPSKGYYVVDFSQSLPSQLGPVPDNVNHINNLEQALALLIDQ